MPFPIAAAIAGGANLLGQAGNALFQGGQNRKNRDFTREMYQTQKQDSIDFWNMQNTYNSPEQQMQRLQQAGLNPNMVYGSGSAVNVASAPSVPHASTPNNQAPRVDTGQIVDSYFNAQTRQATVSNMQKQGDLLDAEKSLKQAELVKLLQGNRFGEETFDWRKETVLRNMNLKGYDQDIKNNSLELMAHKLKQMILTQEAIKLDNDNRQLRGQGFGLDNKQKSINVQSSGNTLDSQMKGMNLEAWMKLLIGGVGAIRR